MNETKIYSLTHLLTALIKVKLFESVNHSAYNSVPVVVLPI